MLLWSEKHQKCAYDFIKRGSCKDQENCTQCLIKKQKIESKSTINDQQPRYCFSELQHAGSCPRGNDNCRFEHTIPEELRNDKAAQAAYIQQREEKRPKCVNEYRKQDSCKKGKTCRFSHKISPEERADPQTQELMRHKYENVRNRGTKKTIPATVNEPLTLETVQKMFNQFLTQLNTRDIIRP